MEVMSLLTVAWSSCSTVVLTVSEMQFGLIQPEVQTTSHFTINIEMLSSFT
jgi:hypothetical protein